MQGRRPSSCGGEGLGSLLTEDSPWQGTQQLPSLPTLLPYGREKVEERGQRRVKACSVPPSISSRCFLRSAVQLALLPAAPRQLWTLMSLVQNHPETTDIPVSCAQKTRNLQSLGFDFSSYREDVISGMRQPLTMIYCAVLSRETSSLATCGQWPSTRGGEFSWAYKCCKNCIW